MFGPDHNNNPLPNNEIKDVVDLLYNEARKGDLEALETLKEMSKLGHEGAIVALGEIAEEVNEDAIETLIDIAKGENGSEFAVEALAEIFEAKEGDAQIVLIEKITETGNEVVLDALAKKIDDKKLDGAIIALKDLADNQNKAALKILAKISEAGNRDALNALITVTFSYDDQEARDLFDRVLKICYEQKAEQGDVSAQIELGDIYNDECIDYELAYKWYKKAAEQSTEGKEKLHKFIINLIFDPNEINPESTFFEELAKNGDYIAEYILANKYLHEDKIDLAMSYCEKIIEEKGDVGAFEFFEQSAREYGNFGFLAYFCIKGASKDSKLPTEILDKIDSYNGDDLFYIATNLEEYWNYPNIAIDYYEKAADKGVHPYSWQHLIEQNEEQDEEDYDEEDCDVDNNYDLDNLDEESEETYEENQEQDSINRNDKEQSTESEDEDDEENPDLDSYEGYETDEYSTKDERGESEKDWDEKDDYDDDEYL